MRAQHQEQARQWVLERLKFIDESGVNLALTRSHGRAAPGERVVEAVPQNYGSNVTLLAALSLNGVSAPWMLEGSVDTGAFRLYLEQVLGPALQPGDIVVIPGGIEHEAFFPEDTEVIDVFAPPREDFLAGGLPPYMDKS